MAGEQLKTILKTVVFTDISSSTTIFDMLRRAEEVGRWKKVLGDLKEFLRTHSAPPPFKVHKFLGDGWILFFEPDIESEALIGFLEEFADLYRKLYCTHVVRVLQNTVERRLGMTFGIDRGSLVLMEMFQKPEYVGRALNVAARLQASRENGDDDLRENRVLISANAYDHMRGESDHFSSNHRAEDVYRQLNNIEGGENFKCKQLWLLETPR